MRSSTTAALGCALALSLPGMALACGAGADRTHYGKLTGVDTGAGSFTIVDAETRQPVTFEAAPSLLESLQARRGPVAVTYEELGDGGIRATGVNN